MHAATLPLVLLVALAMTGRMLKKSKKQKSKRKKQLPNDAAVDILGEIGIGASFLSFCFFLVFLLCSSETRTRNLLLPHAQPADQEIMSSHLAAGTPAAALRRSPYSCARRWTTALDICGAMRAWIVTLPRTP